MTWFSNEKQHFLKGHKQCHLYLTNFSKKCFRLLGNKLFVNWNCLIQNQNCCNVAGINLISNLKVYNSNEIVLYKSLLTKYIYIVWQKTWLGFTYCKFQVEHLQLLQLLPGWSTIRQRLVSFVKSEATKSHCH